MWELDHKEGWVLKNWCFRTVDCKEIKPVNPKGNQPWIFIGRTDTEADIPILWPPDPKSWLIWKNPDAGKDWGQEEKGMTEDEMVEWHHWLNGHEFEQILGDDKGQGSGACCSPWGHKVSDTTEWLKWLTESFIISIPLMIHPICSFLLFSAFFSRCYEAFVIVTLK